LKAQRNAQIETNTRFGNLKRANIFKVFEEAIKQMKRLQNRGMVNGDDKNDMEDMETWSIKVKMKRSCVDKHKKTIITRKKKKKNQKYVDKSYGNS